MVAGSKPAPSLLQEQVKVASKTTAAKAGTQALPVDPKGEGMATERKKQQDRERMQRKREKFDKRMRLAELVIERVALTLDLENYPDNGSLESQLGILARAFLDGK